MYLSSRSESQPVLANEDEEGGKGANCPLAIRQLKLLDAVYFVSPVLQSGQSQITLILHPTLRKFTKLTWPMG